jgi:hypothetical protein
MQRTGSLKRRLRCAFVIGHGGGGHLTAMNAIKVSGLAPVARASVA